MVVKDLQHCIEESVFLNFVGMSSFACFAVILAYQVYRFFKIHFTPPGVDFKSFGKWALVTGSTDGIGKGIARELASRGVNIILVSRNLEKLERVAKELENESKIETKYVKFDFTQEDESTGTAATLSAYDVIRDAIKGLEIGILVNNVGKPADYLREYLKCFDSLEGLAKGSRDLVNCNITSMSKVTQLVLPQMVKRGKGLVINVSSIAASNVCPTFLLYSSSKRFNDTFSNAISWEYQEKGIIVQSIKPGRVSTNLTQSERKQTPGILFPEYLDYVRHLMRTLGKARVTTGYWYHHLQNIFVESIPEKMMVRGLKVPRS